MLDLVRIANPAHAIIICRQVVTYLRVWTAVLPQSRGRTS